MKTFAIGIDLGTSNSSLAIYDQENRCQTVPVLQVVDKHSLDRRPLLASNLYLPNEQESFPAPQWQKEGETVGLFAREHGMLTPDRLISSVKSWLGNPHIDARKPILPWQSPVQDKLLSPLEVSRRYLEHLRFALHDWLQQQGRQLTDDDYEAVITVPASFDQVARTYTAEAAQAAGWQHVTLLEEQQAAFYSWLHGQGDDWRKQVQEDDLILVCDVGGGTADFSLIAVARDEQGNLQLQRVSVGDHILLGGDNIDLALAYLLKAELDGKGTKLDNWQFQSLVHSCRVAKEHLFGNPQMDKYPISIVNRGARLFGRTISTALTREQLNMVAVEGFLPLCNVDEHPQAAQRSGLREFGLDYASDPALSRHLARFLVRSAENILSLDSQLHRHVREQDGIKAACPTAILFNGGFFKADMLRQRVLDILRRFNGATPLRELAGADYDLAVARGAAVYANTLVTGEGIRIKAGTARSYYIGLESSMPAIPGLTLPLQAICVAPQGMEEGSEQRLDEEQFGLLTGEPVDFRFFSSAVRGSDQVGTRVADASELDETTSLEVCLPALPDQKPQLVPVRLHAVITELGVLQLWMQHTDSEQRWNLEFSVREG